MVSYIRKRAFYSECPLWHTKNQLTNVAMASLGNIRIDLLLGSSQNAPELVVLAKKVSKHHIFANNIQSIFH